jgi:hypothetical protein
VSITLDAEAFSQMVEPGNYQLRLGGAASGKNSAEAAIQLAGNAFETE